MIITKEKFGAYEGKWIALRKKDEKVLSSGRTIKEVVKKLKSGYGHGTLFMYVTPFNTYLAPTVRTHGI